MQNKQKGIALIISMIMLLMMTLLGVSAMKTSMMEQKMAGNTRDVTIAFQAAETGLRDAEVWLENQTTEPEATSTGANRVWIFNAPDPDAANAVNWWQERNQTWWLSSAQAYGTAIANVNTVPHSVIEYKQFIRDDLGVGSGGAETGRIYYQITAKGTGGSDQARVLVQSTTARRF